MSTPSSPNSPNHGRPASTSPAGRHDSLSIFTPVKRNTANPLFLPSPSSTATPSPAKRPRLDFGQDRTTAEAGPSRQLSADARRTAPLEPVEDLLAIFDQDSDDDRSDHGMGRNHGNMTIQHGTEEGGLNGNAMDPYSMGNGAGALIGRDLGGTRDEDEEDTGGGKKRRVMPKMDHDRLLGKNGFPALIQEAKKFKIKGKGHEATDLSNLLEMYRLWAHKMYPKATFGDTVTKVESLCHSRLMSSTLSRYKDEAKREAEEKDRPPVVPLELDTGAAGPSSPAGSVDGRDRGSEDEGEGEGGTRSRSIPRDLEDNPFLSPRSRARLALDRARHMGVDVGAGSARTGQVETDEQEEEEMDMDAVIAAAEAEARGLSAQSPEATAANKGKAREDTMEAGYDIPPGFEDDEDDWAAMDDM